MSFMEVHGGWWQMKELPEADNFQKQVQLNEKVGIPAETTTAIYEALKNAESLPKSEIKDLGDGLYCIDAHYGGQVTTIKFTLDGKPTENTKPLEGGVMHVSATYEDGVITTVFHCEGRPDMTIVRKLVNGEIEQTKSCEGISFTDYEAKL